MHHVLTLRIPHSYLVPLASVSAGALTAVVVGMSHPLPGEAPVASGATVFSRLAFTPRSVEGVQAMSLGGAISPATAAAAAEVAGRFADTAATPVSAPRAAPVDAPRVTAVPGVSYLPGAPASLPRQPATVRGARDHDATDRGATDRTAPNRASDIVRTAVTVPAPVFAAAPVPTLARAAARPTIRLDLRRTGDRHVRAPLPFDLTPAVATAQPRDTVLVAGVPEGVTFSTGRPAGVGLWHVRVADAKVTELVVGSAAPARFTFAVMLLDTDGVVVNGLEVAVGITREAGRDVFAAAAPPATSAAAASAIAARTAETPRRTAPRITGTTVASRGRLRETRQPRRAPVPSAIRPAVGVAQATVPVAGPAVTASSFPLRYPSEPPATPLSLH
jgi:hypothetical protein